ncbi:MAG: hypothetical protein ABEI06_06030 [Halobacteriaceae archaeon]
MQITRRHVLWLIRLMGLSLVIGGLFIGISFVSDGYSLGGITINFYVLGGALFVLGFILGSLLYYVQRQQIAAVAQFVASIGWALILISPIFETTYGLLYIGLGLVFLGGIVLIRKGTTFSRIKNE